MGEPELVPELKESIKNGRKKQTHQGRLTTRTANRLDGAETFKLWSELVKAKEELESIHASDREAAEMMTRRLGFQVNHHHVKSAQEAGVVAWDHKKPVKPASERKGKWRATVHDHEDRIEALEETLRRVCLFLGVEYTPGGKKKE